MSQLKGVIIGVLVIGFVIHIAGKFSWSGPVRKDVCKQLIAGWHPDVDPKVAKACRK